jgi:hypothetical protein
MCCLKKLHSIEMSFIAVFLIQKGALQNPAEATIGGM